MSDNLGIAILEAKQASALERTRVRVGGGLILAAILLVLAVIWILVREPNLMKDSKDVVAILGTVTTFLGTIVGSFFGVHVGQAGKAQSDKAAQVANQSASQSASAAKEANATATAALSMVRSAQLNGAQSRDSSRQFATANGARSVRMKVALASKMSELHSLVATDNLSKADALHAAITNLTALTSGEIVVAVENIVTTWIGDRVGSTPEQVDVSKTFQDAPEDGFGMDHGAYKRMCDECTREINAQLNCVIEMAVEWRANLETGRVDAYIAEAAKLAIKALSDGGAQ